MFFQTQKPELRKEYEHFLKIAGCLSNLFSESDVPYLYYRIAEKVFCRAFEAEDLSRSDVSADAKKGALGIGLKTFLANNNRTFQKVAEFNNDRKAYENLSPENLVRKISELRNARIEFTENAHALEKSIYHCVIRDKGKFIIFEELMDKVDISNIGNIKKRDSSIIFDDGKHDYSFLISKSTLTKRFISEPIVYDFNVEILKDPLLELRELLQNSNLHFEKKSKIIQTIYLPLHGKKQIVFEKSGLNQWNAGGRDRNPNEVYIPVPAEIHKFFPDFFPDRETPFDLKLPNGKTMQSKICQDGGKALMSYSNRELGQWILRDVLKLREGELLTYNRLQILGIDSVRIDKIDNSNFEINFAKVGSYEQFKNILERE